MEDELIRRLLSTMKCVVCGQRYAPDDINVLGHRENLWFVGVLCPACGNRGLVAAAVNSIKAKRFVTDLSEAEQTNFADLSPVNTDDLLEVRHFLKNFDGDFSRLFSRN